jgi:alpha-L-fucosidase 2
MITVTRKNKMLFRIFDSVLANTSMTIFVLIIGVTHAIAQKTNPISNSLTIWENTPVDPSLVSKKNVGIHVKKGNQKIQWDVWGLPMGNGNLGAVFYGNVIEELIQFNENSLWSGGAVTRFLDKEGEMQPSKRNFGSYQPFGDVHISLPHSDYSDYHRELDISRSVGVVTYKSNGVKYRREYFVSYPDQVMVIRLSADKSKSITGSIKLTDTHFAKISVEKNTIRSQGKLDENFYISKGFYKVDYGTKEQRKNAKFLFAGNNMKYEAQLSVLTDGGSVIKGKEGELKVVDANSVTILLTAGTDYIADASKSWRGEDPHAKVSQQMEKASKKSFDELLANHVQDYQSLFNRLKLDLGKTDPKKLALPMQKRIEDYRENSEDPELVALLTQFGRYLLICSSRPGSLPANLQGVWNPDRVFAPWSADYHLNVNLQMNYWLSGPGNISESDEPLIYWLQSIIPVLKNRTRETFNTRGWCAGWAVNIFGGGKIEKKIEGAWLCMHLYEHYQFTHDKKMLKEVSFPIIQQAVYFWEDNLIEKDGFLLAPQVISPEWGQMEDGVLYAQEIIWELFSEYIEIADILGTDRAHRNKIIEMRDKLATPKVGSKGQLMEWQTEHPERWNKQHRHSSHLIGLYPGRQISPNTTPKLAKASEVTLENRGVGKTGWSKIHKAAMWTRLFKGEEAMNLVEEFIKTHIWPNGLSAINYGDKFQIDANLGMPAVVFEMLLQSHTDVLHLLPALPSDYKQGSIQGIRGRGGFLVDISWENGALTQAVIRSTFGEFCKVKYGDKEVALDIKKGEKVVLDLNLEVLE